MPRRCTVTFTPVGIQISWRASKRTLGLYYHHLCSGSSKLATCEPLLLELIADSMNPSWLSMNQWISCLLVCLFSSLQIWLLHLRVLFQNLYWSNSIIKAKTMSARLFTENQWEFISMQLVLRCKTVLSPHLLFVVVRVFKSAHWFCKSSIKYVLLPCW